MKNEKIPKFTEVECKYKVESEQLIAFKNIAESLPGLKRFIYSQGRDRYYKNENGNFARYRVEDFLQDGKPFAEWTVKEKFKNAKDNVFRFESNWRVDGTPSDEMHAGAIKMGYSLDFIIKKYCHIYKYDEVTLVFYTVLDENDASQSFLEIEIEETIVHNLTQNEAWKIIEKYEKSLKSLNNIGKEYRLSFSLLEMYAK